MTKLVVMGTGSFCQIYRVTDEAKIAETAVWPNFFLMNIFFALKGSKLFIIILKIMAKFGCPPRYIAMVRHFNGGMQARVQIIL